ncbi:MAG: FHA domain-containing protein [Candidatus Aureabacteria bacterium]|nr:FHA domain-containing protein [Candidatus Auribacterota bacterium]
MPFSFFKKKSSSDQKTEPLRKESVELKTDQFFTGLHEEDKSLFRSEEKNGYALVIEEGSRKGKKIILIGTEILIGRSVSNDITVDDLMVSEKHVLLTIKRGEIPHLEDLDSTNGTLVNGKRVLKIQLKEGDSIQIGRTLFRFKMDI